MGGAIDPLNAITPGLGFKCPRSGMHDGDFVSFYSLVQGAQWDFFGKNQSTHITPAEGVTKVLAKKGLRMHRIVRTKWACLISPSRQRVAVAHGLPQAVGAIATTAPPL